LHHQRPILLTSLIYAPVGMVNIGARHARLPKVCLWRALLSADVSLPEVSGVWGVDLQVLVGRSLGSGVSISGVRGRDQVWGPPRIADSSLMTESVTPVPCPNRRPLTHAEFAVLANISSGLGKTISSVDASARVPVRACTDGNCDAGQHDKPPPLLPGQTQLAFSPSHAFGRHDLESCQKKARFLLDFHVRADFTPV